MNKNEYMKRLEKALSSVSKEERERTLSYYSELIDDRVEEGMDEQRVVSELEPPEAVASRLMAEGVIKKAGPRSGRNTGLIVGVSIAVLLLAAIIVVPIVSFMRYDRNGDASIQDGESAAAQAEEVVKDYPIGTNFNFELVRTDLDILPSQDNSFHLHYVSDERYQLKIKEEGNTVTLWEKDHKQIVNFGFVETNRKAILYVPADAEAVVDFYAISGDLSVRDLDLEQLLVCTVSGNAVLTKVSTSEELIVETTSGDAKMMGCTLGAIDVNVVSGDMELENTSFEKLSFNSVSGDLEGDLLGSPQDYDVEFNSMSGGNSLKNVQGGPIEISFNSVSGDLDLDFEGWDFDDD